MHLEKTFKAHGHANIRGTHRTTIELTKESRLSLRGDCIVAVSAEKGLRELRHGILEAAKNSNAVITLKIQVDNHTVEIKGKGDPRLNWDHPTDMVTRTSGYTCSRTLMVYADKASRDLPREFIQSIKDSNKIINVKISVEAPDI